MLRQTIAVCACTVMLAAIAWTSPTRADDDQATVINNPFTALISTASNYPEVGIQDFGFAWAESYNPQNWDRYYHHLNAWSCEYNRQLHDKYSAGARWNKYYSHSYKRPPGGRRIHYGHPFILDTF
ncbi:MAG: hypothetical protein SGJ20_16600 [Planctomycetota bacterium]|nr:hypothetical protein [Planctomycetota bacterium]